MSGRFFVTCSYIASRRPWSAPARLGLDPNDGALAITYQRAKGNHPRVNRMDRLYVSQHFAVRDVETLYDEALTVGSDHALVVASVELPLGRDQPDDGLAAAEEVGA